MYQALYRAYRPEVFSEILGQEHIIKILQNQLKSDTVSHAYLFCGTHGTGKTTTARILAKGLNCLAEGERPCGTCENCRAIKDGAFMDVIEMDAASNNGVENIRELRESVQYPPAAGRKKVYIIDEVHMLSPGAFNALLKTLEEPPENVVFILATTEPQRLPATILSRCMRLDFHRVPEGVLTQGMQAICRDKGVDVSEDALRLIAANADGSVRDGLSILDQCLSLGGGTVRREDVLAFLGTSGIEVFLELTELVRARRTAEALLLLAEALADGKDVRQFMRDWLAHFRGLLISKFVKQPADILNLSEENTARLAEQAERLDASEINQAILELSRTMADAKWSTQPRVLLELCIVKLAESGLRREAPQRAARSGNVPAQQPIQPARALRQQPAQAPDRSAQEQQSVNAQAQQPVQDASVSRPQEATAPVDLELLWRRVFEDGESFKTSFNLIRSGTQLTKLTETEFFVSASSSLKQRYVRENAETLERLMEKHTGVRRRLRCAEATEAAASKELNIDEIRSQAEDVLGVKVEIE